MATAEELFTAICDAVVEDGKVEAWEAHLMSGVATLLELEQEKALSIFSEARKKAARYGVADAHARRLELYTQLVDLVCADGTVDNLEHATLEGVRRAFKITDGEHKDAVLKATGE